MVGRGESLALVVRETTGATVDCLTQERIRKMTVTVEMTEKARKIVCDEAGVLILAKPDGAFRINHEMKLKNATVAGALYDAVAAGVGSDGQDAR